MFPAMRLWRCDYGWNSHVCSGCSCHVFWTPRWHISIRGFWSLSFLDLCLFARRADRLIILDLHWDLVILFSEHALEHVSFSIVNVIFCGASLVCWFAGRRDLGDSLDRWLDPWPLLGLIPLAGTRCNAIS
jgi:hypothetical protein